MALVVLKAPADKFSRLAKMTMDFLLWSIDNPPADDRQGPGGPNMLLISRLLQDDKFCCLDKLNSLSSRGHNVFLAFSAAGNIPPQVYSVQLLSWQDLSTVGKCKSLHPRPEDRTLFK